MCICERVVVVLLPNLPAGRFVLARRIKLQAYAYGVLTSSIPYPLSSLFPLQSLQGAIYHSLVDDDDDDDNHFFFFLIPFCALFSLPFNKNSTTRTRDVASTFHPPTLPPSDSPTTTMPPSSLASSAIVTLIFGGCCSNVRE